MTDMFKVYLAWKSTGLDGWKVNVGHGSYTIKKVKVFGESAYDLYYTQDGAGGEDWIDRRYCIFATDKAAYKDHKRKRSVYGDGT